MAYLEGIANDLNNLAAAGELDVGAPVLNIDASAEASNGGAKYNTYDDTIYDWSTRGQGETKVVHQEYTGDNVTYINETEIAYK